MKRSKEERQNSYRHNLESCYDQIDKLEINNSINRSPSYIKRMNKLLMEQLIKNGRHLPKDDNFNAHVNKLLESISTHASLYSLFYPDKKPLYMYNLNHYSDTLTDAFIHNFEGNFINNSVKSSPAPLENIALYAKILQHYDMFDKFNPALIDSYIDYIHTSNNIYESFKWFYLTEDTTPEVDKIVIDNILNTSGSKAMNIVNNMNMVDHWTDDLQSPLYVLAICEIIADNFRHTFSIRDRFFRYLPEEYQLGYFI